MGEASKAQNYYELTKWLDLHSLRGLLTWDAERKTILKLLEKSREKRAFPTPWGAADDNWFYSGSHGAEEAVTQSEAWNT